MKKGLKAPDLTGQAATVAGTFVPANKEALYADYWGLQSCNTTHLLGLITHKGRTTVNPIKGEVKWTHEDGTTFSILNYNMLSDLNVVAMQVLDFIMCKFQDSGFKTNEIEIPYSDFMQARRIPRRHYAIKQLDDATDILCSIVIKATEQYNQLLLGFDKCGILSRARVKKDSKTFLIVMDETFFSMVKGISYIRYHKNLIGINTKLHAPAFYIGKSILRYTYMNRKKINGAYGTNTTSIRVLLNECPAIPTVEEVLSSEQRSVDKRIVQRFKEELAYLVTGEKILEEVTYLDPNGKELNDFDLEGMHYSEFLNCHVRTKAANYPQNLPPKRKRAATKKKRK